MQSTGQGHVTVFARLAAERLGISPDEVEVEQGDSDFGIQGAPAVGSRSAMTVGHALVAVSDKMLAKAQRGRSQTVRGVRSGHRLSRRRLRGARHRPAPARCSTRRPRRRDGRARRNRGELDSKGTAETPLTFPNGCHIAEVEIDPDTGTAQVVTYTCVDDCGNVLDHTIVEGQVWARSRRASARR